MDRPVRRDRDYERFRTDHALLLRRPILRLVAATMLLLVEVGNQAGAESHHRGMVEYEVACMPCHGIDGRTGEDLELSNRKTDLATAAWIGD